MDRCQTACSAGPSGRANRSTRSRRRRAIKQRTGHPEPLPVKKTVKKYKVFIQPSRYAGLWESKIWVFCCGRIPISSVFVSRTCSESSRPAGACGEKPCRCTGALCHCGTRDGHPDWHSRPYQQITLHFCQVQLVLEQFDLNLCLL